MGSQATAMQCPACGVAVEDEGLCVGCWDSRVDAQVNAWSESFPEQVLGRAIRMAQKSRRDAEMLEAYRQGVPAKELAERYGLSVRTVFHSLYAARRAEREVTA